MGGKPNKIVVSPVGLLPLGLKIVVFGASSEDSWPISDGRFLEKLTNLTILCLDSNQISDGRFLEKLTNLTTLDLSSNQISDLAPLLNLIKNGIRTNLEKYGGSGISLYDTPLQNPPIEIVQQGNEAILEYFKQKEKTGAKPLLEFKLVLLGDGRAGKTSLACRLLR